MLEVVSGLLDSENSELFFQSHILLFELCNQERLLIMAARHSHISKQQLLYSAAKREVQAAVQGMESADIIKELKQRQKQCVLGDIRSFPMAYMQDLFVGSGRLKVLLKESQAPTVVYVLC